MPVSRNRKGFRKRQKHNRHVLEQNRSANERRREEAIQKMMEEVQNTPESVVDVINAEEAFEESKEPKNAFEHIVEGEKIDMVDSDEVTEVEFEENVEETTPEPEVAEGPAPTSTDELLAQFVEAGLVTKSGSWYSHGDTKLGQGKDAAVTTLNANPEIFIKLKGELNGNSEV